MELSYTLSASIYIYIEPRIVIELCIVCIDICVCMLTDEHVNDMQHSAHTLHGLAAESMLSKYN